MTQPYKSVGEAPSLSKHFPDDFMGSVSHRSTRSTYLICQVFLPLPPLSPRSQTGRRVIYKMIFIIA